MTQAKSKFDREVRKERLILINKIENMINTDPELENFYYASKIDAALDLILHSYYDLVTDPDYNWEAEKERLKYSFEVIIRNVDKRLASTK